MRGSVNGESGGIGGARDMMGAVLVVRGGVESWGVLRCYHVGTRRKDVVRKNR